MICRDKDDEEKAKIRAVWMVEKEEIE